MLLRLRGPDGMIRLNIEPTISFRELASLVSLFSAPQSNSLANGSTPASCTTS